MANMERIIRPHLPPNIAPPESVPKCQVPPGNTITKLDAPSAALQAVLQNADLGTPAGGKALSATSNYSYSAKWYMTKREKEKGKKKDASRPVDTSGPGGGTPGVGGGTPGVGGGTPGVGGP